MLHSRSGGTGQTPEPSGGASLAPWHTALPADPEKRMRLTLHLAMAIALLPQAAAAQESAPRTEVLRVETRDPAVIQDLASRHTHLIVDTVKGLVVVEADPMERAVLKAAGLRWQVDDDASAAINRPLRRLPGHAKGIPGYPCYRTVAEAKSRLDQLAAQYPTLASVVDIGDTWEKTAAQPGGGEDLRVLRLTNLALTGDKPRLFIMTSVHAREYTPAEVGLRFGEWLLANHGSDPEATAILDRHEVHLLVHANPDGRKRAETALSWRKNTNTSYCGATSTMRGADLNRNWPFKWGQAVGGGGSSTNPCADTYRGPSASSEPETATIVAYVRSLYPDRRGPLDTDAADLDTDGLFFDIHSYSQLVLWPWGWTTAGAGPAPNAAPLEALGRRFAWHTGYTPQQSNELYVTDGTTNDTVYGELGVPAYAFELGTAFFQDCALFENTIWPDNLRALRFAARTLHRPYRVAAGPDARAVVTDPDLPIESEPVVLSAVLDDTRYSNANGGSQAAQAIAGATAWVGAPPWSTASGHPLPMTAADGAFNATVETVRATLATPPAGRTLAWVRGRDAAGNDGPWATGWVQVYAASAVGEVAGTVRAAGSGAPLAGATVAAAGFASTSAANGTYSRRLPAGTHTILASAPGHESTSLPGTLVAGGGQMARDITLFALCRRAGSDAESGAGAWTAQAPWAITAAATAQTGSRAWTESPAGQYANNANTSLVSPTVDLTSHENPVLSFDSWCDTEPGYDFGNVEYSTDGGTSWSTFAWRCSGDPALRRIALDLPQIAGSAQARLRFRFTSDGSVARDGWYVDNIALDAGGPACRATQGPSDTLFGSGFEP